MADKTHLEEALEFLINEEEEKAVSSFHKFIVDRARTIHESLLEDDDELDENIDSEEVDESKEEEVDESKDEVEESKEEVEESKDEEVEESKDEEVDESKKEEVDESMNEFFGEDDLEGEEMGGDEFGGEEVVGDEEDFLLYSKITVYYLRYASNYGFLFLGVAVILISSYGYRRYKWR